MKRKHLNFSKWEKESLKDPAFKAEYDKLEPEFAVVKAVLDARLKKGMTQQEIARRIGTKQSVISRLERGRANPSVAFLKRLATAVGSRLEIRFVSS